jgi:hypothetical protein
MTILSGLNVMTSTKKYHAEHETPQNVLGETSLTFQATNELHTSLAIFEPYRFHLEGGASWLGWFEKAFSNNGPEGIYTTPVHTQAFIVAGKQGYLVNVPERSVQCLPSPVSQVCSLDDQQRLLIVSMWKLFIISADCPMAVSADLVTDDLQIIDVQADHLFFSGFVAQFGEVCRGELRLLPSDHGVQFIRWL